MNKLSLSARITLLLGIAVVLILAAAAQVMDHMIDAEVEQRMDDGLLAQARALEALVDVGSKGLNVNDVMQAHPHALAGNATAFWAIHCADGSVATSQPPPAAYPAEWMRSARNQPAFANVHASDTLMRAVWLRVTADRADAPRTDAAGMERCSVIFMRPRARLDDILATIDAILLLIPVLAALAVLLLSPILVRRGLRPVATLGEAMRDIGPHAPGQRLQSTGTRELEPLVARFNEVLARMDEGVARERQFTGALAHETRTHLAELRALVEVEQRYPSERPLADLLDEIGSIVGDLQDTVSGLLLLTRLEAGIEGMRADFVRPSEVVDRRLESVAERLRQRRLRVDRSAVADATVLVVDRALLEIIVGNLVNNAAAYAPEGSTIGIDVKRQALVIDNDAPDLAAADVAHFGRRFWSKHHGSGGHAGLGLALAGAAATAMRFSLDFDLDTRKRLRATLAWSDDHAPAPGRDPVKPTRHNGKS